MVRYGCNWRQCADGRRRAGRANGARGCIGDGRSLKKIEVTPTGEKCGRKEADTGTSRVVREVDG
jgi:hypothetical protein